MPSRNGHRLNGPGDSTAVTNESVSLRIQHSSSADTDLPRERYGDPADSPITLNPADLAAPEFQMDAMEAPRESGQTYGRLLAGPWKAESSAPIETLAESVLQHVRQPLVVLDAELRARLANHAFCETFQIPPEQIEGRWFPEIGNGDWSVPRLRAFLNQILDWDGQIASVEVEHDLLTIGRKTLVIHARRLIGAGPGDKLILLEIEDVTERDATEQRRRELIVTAIHELRNPLTAIKGYAQFMQERKGTSEKALTIILNQAQQASRLIDDLLASSGPDIAQPSLEPRLMDLVTLARASAQQAQLLGSGHLIRLEVPDEPLEGLWDGGRLNQVFANLLGNAVKYSPAGGEIVVGIQDLGPRIRVSISDQGAGIAAEVLRRIFDQFYRVAATATNVPGLGLGLHVCKTLVEAHGGSISVQSIPGVGSTFAFELPRVTTTSSARAARLLETIR
jgi:two-component system CheB/CheR fusion protein